MRAPIAHACLVAVLLANRATEAQTPAPPIQTADVTYRSGEITLAALLLLPTSERPVPGAVIIQGSGASDRSNQWARAIAEELSRNGIAVLLTDKRGTGASGGDWRVAGFSELAADALAGVAFLQNRHEIDRQRVGLVGLSQGGWVAPLAAARSDDVAFVINVSGAAVGLAEQSFAEMANTARQAGLTEPLVQEVIRLNAAAGKYLATGDWEQYSRARARGLETDARKIAAGFPDSASDPIWTFLRKVAAYDPMPYWILVGQPVLVVYGEEDERDNVPVAESVRRLEHAFRAVRKDNYRVLVVPNVGHGIRDPQTHRLAASFVDTLRSWLRQYVTR
jgi:dipeptidyl aminopeptidase/acylaminoacyl peptidase